MIAPFTVSSHTWYGSAETRVGSTEARSVRRPLPPRRVECLAASIPFVGVEESLGKHRCDGAACDDRCSIGWLRLVGGRWERGEDLLDDTDGAVLCEVSIPGAVTGPPRAEDVHRALTVERHVLRARALAETEYVVLAASRVELVDAPTRSGCAEFGGDSPGGGESKASGNHAHQRDLSSRGRALV